MNFHVNSRKEERLIMSYELILETALGLGGSFATKIAKNMMKAAIKRSKELGDYYCCPENLYDIVENNAAPEGDLTTRLIMKKIEGINLEKFKSEIKEIISTLRKLNMPEEYIKDFLNSGGSEKWMSVEYQNFKFNLMVKKLKPLNPKLSELGVGEGVAKTTPFFDVFNEFPFKVKDDKINGPLDAALIRWVNSYIEERIENDPEAFEKEIQGFSSMNALIRQKLLKS